MTLPKVDSNALGIEKFNLVKKMYICCMKKDLYVIAGCNGAGKA
jgi:ABC-type cobalamin/Fe3+-siderophores transport system ATPase subunit